MDYEKKYKEALERAREYWETDNDNTLDIKAKGTMEYLFPELKESEDEKIRKEIINFLELPHPQFVGKRDHEKWLAWLEKQGEQKQEINNFDVLPGLYKCVHRMFDGTPDGRLLFKVGNVYRCLSKHDRAEFEVSYGHSVYLEDPVVCKHFIPFEKQGEVESDNDDIEVEEKGIREAFNKIEDEKQCKQKPFDYKNQGTQNSHKFNIGDIISNGNVEFRIDNIVKNCVGQDCYFLVDVESEKNGTRYLTMCVRGKKTSHMGETTWLCEQVDKSFKKQGEQKPITEMKSAEESLGISSETYNEIVNDYIFGENKPKFNIGDWVVYYRNDSSREVLQVYDIRDDRYYFTDNVHFSWSVKECDEKSHLWTIQDAKDGDVLAFKNNIGGIIICKSPTDYDTRSYCRLVSDNLINKEESGWDSTLFVPATKEQCGLLFQKMKEAGYEWDADKKELKKISQRMISAEAKEAMYAKTAWSEDDEKMLVDAYVMLDWYKGNNWWTARRIKDWLKSLKDRVQPQSQQEWSEEDEKTIHNIDAAIRHEVVFPIDELKSMEIWLESLKYRVCPKHEWKRDEKMFQLIEDVIDVYRKTQGSVIGGIHTEELKDFLNCIASKQDWKPSDEQMDELENEHLKSVPKY